MSYVLYYKEIKEPNIKAEEFVKLSKNYSLKIWVPHIFDIAPKDLPFKKLWGWCILYLLRLFHIFRYNMVFLVYDNNQNLIHYTVIAAKSCKFSFMRSDDIHIGPSRTEPEYRRKGIGLYVIYKIFEMKSKKNMRFWWMAKEDNIVSQRFIEKVGFSKYGHAAVEKKFGINIYKPIY